MKQLFYILFLLSFSIQSQGPIEATLLKKVPFTAEKLVGFDNFGTLYYTANLSLYKQTEKETINYSNVQLGNITSANTFNNLKINLFYKNFNTVVILDNRLAEVFKIDFNTQELYKNVSLVSTGFDNTLWVFNQDLQQLELFDYKTLNIRAVAMPVDSQALSITSNYNFCWLLTENSLYIYNYFGSLVAKLPNDGFTEISESNGHLILKKDNTLVYLAKDSETFMPIQLPELLIKQFLVTNETLYIYDQENLHQFQLKIK